MLSDGHPLIQQAEDPSQNYDELDVHRNSSLKGYIPSDEVIYFSGKVMKINKRHVAQYRYLIITNKALYNIHPRHTVLSKVAFFVVPSASVRRVIKGERFESVTYSNNPVSDQFVLNINGEYAYQYDGLKKRRKIMKALSKMYSEFHSDPLVFYQKEDQDLKEFHTTDDDFRKKIDKKPKDGQVLIPAIALENSVNWADRRRFNSAAQPRQNDASNISINIGTPYDGNSRSPSCFGMNGSHPIYPNGQMNYGSYLIPQMPIEEIKPIKKIEDIPMTESVQVQHAHPYAQEAPRADDLSQPRWKTVSYANNQMTVSEWNLFGAKNAANHVPFDENAKRFTHQPDLINQV